jgi:3-oxoacyl-[acyl-carrier protein] reductase
MTMDLAVTDRRVLIAGASRGIGLAMTEAFLREGAQVAMLARSAGPLQDAADKLAVLYGREKVLPIVADCAEEGDWGRVKARLTTDWGGLDVAVANVGDGRSVADPLPDTERFALTWRTNFTTAESTARAVLPALEESGGCLLFVSSIAGLEAIGAPTDYSVSKAAIVALTKQLAGKLAPRVRVNCLAPGNVHFPGGSWDDKLRADRHGVEELIASTVPMGRFGTPDEIADAALFLCSERANFITGAILCVDGGQTCSW